MGRSSRVLGRRFLVFGVVKVLIVFNRIYNIFFILFLCCVLVFYVFFFDRRYNVKGFDFRNIVFS